LWRLPVVFILIVRGVFVWSVSRPEMLPVSRLEDCPSSRVLFRFATALWSRRQTLAS
jgi:hypothetical protein